MIRKSLILLLIVMLTMALGAAVTAQDDMETYVLGVALPFTGSFGTFGQDFERGIDLAVAQMNAELEAAGSSIRFETASADTEQTPEGAARAVADHRTNHRRAGCGGSLDHQRSPRRQAIRR